MDNSDPKIEIAEQKLTGRNIKITFIFTDRDASAVIGRGGSTIRDICEKSSCKLNVNGQHGRERYLSIYGPIDKISSAVYFVSQALSRHTAYAADLDARSDENVIMLMLLPDEICGAIIGFNGGNIRNIIKSSGAYIRIFFDHANKSGKQTAKIEGNPECIKKAIECIAKVYDRLYDDLQISNDSENDSRDNNGHSQSSVLASMTSRTQQVMHLDSDVAKVIVGKSGSTINELKAVSGAFIKVENNPSNSTQCIVTLSGNPSSVAVALHLIEAKVASTLSQNTRNRYNNRRRDNGGSYQRGGYNSRPRYRRAYDSSAAVAAAAPSHTSSGPATQAQA